MAFQRKKKNPSQVPENQRTTFLKSELKIDAMVQVRTLRINEIKGKECDAAI